MRKVMYLTDPVLNARGPNTPSDATEFCMAVLNQVVEGATALDIYVSTGGGDAFDMMQVYDVLNGLPRHVKVRMIAMGKVMSAGFFLVCGAKSHVVRSSLPNTTFMWHEPSTTSNGGMRNVKNYVEYLNGGMTKQLNSTLQKRSNLTREEYEARFTGDDTYLTPREMLKLGLIDEIMDRIDLSETAPTEPDLLFKHEPEQGVPNEGACPDCGEVHEQ